MLSLGAFVWQIADQLRGVYRPAQYGGVILPFTILRRLDCLMEPHRDTMRELAAKYDNPMRLGLEVKKATGLGFYNTSAYQFSNLLAEPDSLRVNLQDYLERFSSQIDVFERFKFANELATLEEKDRLYLVVSKFSEIDLHPEKVPNAEMGDLFEELIRKFAEASNEEAGEHYTPRDAIRLMVDLLFAEKDDDLTEAGAVRTIYDPTAGTGGMLSVAEEHLLEQNPDAELVLYGQEINDQSYAICKSDMIAKGQDPSNIRLGDTLAEDLFAEKKFDFCLSNPPYGVDWKASEKAVKAEREAAGALGRFAPGLPAVSDGQMLFLTHLASKMRPPHEDGGRAGIVLNGSPLFNGGAGSGPSEIRRSLLENDLVEAIVALPTEMFFNTGIATYIWILDNTKQPERKGLVQLIDASGMGAKMRKSLGSKRKEIDDETRAYIAGLYHEFADADPSVSKVFANTDFGYWTITVECPLRLNFTCSTDRINRALGAKQLQSVDEDALRKALESVGDEVTYTNRDEFLKVLGPALGGQNVRLTTPQRKALWMALGERDEDGDICVDTKGNPEVDTRLRDTENVPFTYNGNTTGDAGRDATIAAYFETEVVPHVPDAWIDHKKTQVGYEIPFTRHFYVYEQPESLEEIDAQLEEQVATILELLREVEG